MGVVMGLSMESTRPGRGREGRRGRWCRCQRKAWSLTGKRLERLVDWLTPAGRVGSMDNGCGKASTAQETPLTMSPGIGSETVHFLLLLLLLPHLIVRGLNYGLG